MAITKQILDLKDRKESTPIREEGGKYKSFPKEVIVSFELICASLNHLNKSQSSLVLGKPNLGTLDSSHL
jgi:hypothetical protein